MILVYTITLIFFSFCVWTAHQLSIELIHLIGKIAEAILCVYALAERLRPRRYVAVLAQPMFSRLSDPIGA